MARGGKREGSGRKSKAEELGLSALIDKAWPEADQLKVIKKLAADCNARNFHTRQESRKLLLAYKFGKPTEKHEVTGKDGESLSQPIADALISFNKSLEKIYGK